MQNYDEQIRAYCREISEVDKKINRHEAKARELRERRSNLMKNVHALQGMRDIQSQNETGEQ